MAFTLESAANPFEIGVAPSERKHRGDDSTDHAAPKASGPNVHNDDVGLVRDIDAINRERTGRRVGSKTSKVVFPHEKRSGFAEWIDRNVFENVVPVPAFECVARVEALRDLRIGPCPHIPSSVVERAENGFWLQHRIEGDHVPDRAHALVGAACAPEERFTRVPEDLCRPQRGEAFPFDRPSIPLPLVPMEHTAVVRDLEGDAHAKEYLLHNISSAVVPTIRVVLVEPKNEGNVGAVARSMKNFGVAELVLVNPCRLEGEARQRAMRGIDILEAARTVGDIEDALKDADLIIGTSGVDTESEKRFARISVTPREFAVRVAQVHGRIALMFGREDFGLLDGELRRCDLLVTIPASPDYPILNLSHAVTILLYDLHTTGAIKHGKRKASGMEKEKLHEAFRSLLVETDYPAHKRARTQVMFRRLIGRAVPSKWEFHALMGVIQRATKRIQRLERKDE